MSSPQTISNWSMLNCSAEYKTGSLMPYCASSILFCILGPGCFYNLFCLRTILKNKQTETWLKTLLTNACLCALLYDAILILITAYNIVIIALELDLEKQTLCRLLDYPFVLISTFYLCSVLFIAATLLHRKNRVERTSVCKSGVTISSFAVMFMTLIAGNLSSLISSTPDYDDCYCHYILTAKQHDLLIRFSLEILPLSATVIIFCYVYRKSKMRVLDFDVESVACNLHRRVMLWKVATNARGLLPWAIIHTMFIVLIALVSLAVVHLQEVVSWRNRIVLVMVTLYLQAIDLVLQPLILIRSSYSLKAEVSKMSSWTQKLLFPCVYYRLGSDLVQAELSILNANSHVNASANLEKAWHKVKRGKAK